MSDHASTDVIARPVGPGGRPRILAVTSGKGGVGKTNMAVNLALCLRVFGGDVLLIDADMGLGNVDVLLNLDVTHDLRDVILHGRPIEHVVVDGPRGLKILPGASGIEELTRLSDQQLGDFLGQIERYCAGMDFVVVDTAPGVSSGVVRYLLAADEIVLVTNSEPTAMTDAYALLKVLSRHPESQGKSVSVIMNQTGSKEEAIRSFDRLRLTVKRFLDREVEYLGSVAWDESVGMATKQQVDFLTHYANAPCSRDLRKIAARLVSSDQWGATDMNRFFRKIIGVPDE